MKKTLKITAIIIISLLVLVLVAVGVCCYVHSLPKYDKEETQIFKNKQEEFKLINDYVLANFGSQPDEVNIMIVRDFSNIRGLYDNEDIVIGEDLKIAFNSIDKCFNDYDFSFIEINDERISYGGLGYRMYVYSRNGKAPTYYYHEGDGMHPEVYNLCDNWYLLKVNFI